MRSIAADLFGVCADEELPAKTSSWVRTATDSAVTDVCDVSVEMLVGAMDRLLSEAPPTVARRLDEAAIRHDLGIR